MLKKVFVLTAVMVNLGVTGLLNGWFASTPASASDEMVADCPWCAPPPCDPNCGCG